MQFEKHRLQQPMTGAERTVILLSMFISMPGVWLVMSFIQTTFDDYISPWTKPYYILVCGLVSLVTWMLFTFMWYVFLGIALGVFHLTRKS